LFLAGKVEDTPRQLKDVIYITYIIRHKKDKGAEDRIKQSRVRVEPVYAVVAAYAGNLDSISLDLLHGLRR
jgi:cyclin T